MNNFPSHVSWLITNRGHALLNKVAGERVHIGVENAVQHVMSVFVEADPSARKLAVDWLVTTYLNDGFLWEDISQGKESKVFETLEHFARFRDRLGKEHKNLKCYGSIASVWRAIEPFLPTEEKSKRSLKRELQAEVLENSIMLKEQSKRTIVVPLNEEAAEWWSQGTRWCTAGKNNNVFWSYAHCAPLIIISFIHEKKAVYKNRKVRAETNVNKLKKLVLLKFQLWVTPNRFQFMDEYDSGVRYGFVWKNWHVFREVILWASRICSQAWNFIPQEEQTSELFLELARTFPEAIKHIKKNEHSIELYRRALDINPMTLMHMREEYRTSLLDYGICSSLITRLPEAAQFFPKDIWDQKLADNFLSRMPSYVEWVPHKFTSQKYWSKGVRAGCALKHVPAEYKTTQLIRSALKNNGFSIFHVPKEKHNLALWRKAVAQNASILEYVPLQFCTAQICTMAVKKYGWAIRWVPKELRTIDLLKQAVLQTGLCLKVLEEVEISIELCWLAIQTHPASIKYIPRTLINEEMIMMAVEMDGKLLNVVPQDLLTPKIVDKALQKDPYGVWNSLHIKVKHDLKFSFSIDIDLSDISINRQLCKQAAPRSFQWNNILLDPLIQSLKEENA